jgi:hypothetical protein
MVPRNINQAGTARWQVQSVNFINKSMRSDVGRKTKITQKSAAFGYCSYYAYFSGETTDRQIYQGYNMKDF